MSRADARQIQQALEGLTVTGGGGGNESEMLTTHSDGSATSFIAFDGAHNVFGFNFSDQGGGGVITIADDTTDKFSLNIGNSETVNISLSPNYTAFGTNVTFKKYSGTLRYSIIYQDG